MLSKESLKRAHILSLTGLLILTLFSVTSTAISNARAQETFPDNIFASTSQAQLHELSLKATQENGQTNMISGFKVDLTNIISTPLGSELAVFTTDSTLSITEAKLKTTADAFIDLKKKSQSSFSLAGLPAGVYTIDVITQKGAASGAYEGILVLGREPTDSQTKTIIEQQITKEDDDDDDNGVNCDPSYPTVCIKSPPPDLDCANIPHKNFKVTGSDPHGLDRDRDGVGCESNESKLPIDPCLDNPTLMQCIDPCEENPDLQECQEPIPPEDPCEENSSLPECEEEEEFVGESDDDEGGDDEDESDGDSDSENENVEDDSDGGNDEGDEE